ncbi:tripartite tricarboxylate transporter substrate binding protein [Rhizobium jaguaris]|uniref:Bug family tripartite tricarboxylate transporter substrate binding protein n=1 Tax=Rhizobium jaguaris TaxID=1312183 RepID=UPI0039BF9FC2
MKKPSLWSAICAAALAFAAVAAEAQAADWPTGPVKLIVPLAAGGSSDIAARALAQGLSARWKQPVVVENRTGGSTIIAAQYVLGQPADGYTIDVFPTTHSINPGVRSSMPFDTMKDFSYAAMFMDAPMAIFANPKFPASSLQELIAEAKKHPDQPILFASPGVASAGHMGGALLQSLTGIKLQHVAYTGSATALPDVLSGRVPLFITPLTGLTQYVDNGQLKLISVLGAARAKQYPNVAAASEIVPGLVVRAFTGIAVRAGTSPEVIQKIADNTKAVVNSPEYAQVSNSAGFVPWVTSPKETTDLMQHEVDQWKQIAAK